MYIFNIYISNFIYLMMYTASNITLMFQKMMVKAFVELIDYIF